MRKLKIGIFGIGIEYIFLFSGIVISSFAFWLGWECPRLVVPTFSFFQDTRGTFAGHGLGQPGTCPQKGVFLALKNEDTGHENPRLRDTKGHTYVS